MIDWKFYSASFEVVVVVVVVVMVVLSLLWYSRRRAGLLIHAHVRLFLPCTSMLLCLFVRSTVARFSIHFFRASVLLLVGSSKLRIGRHCRQSFVVLAR